MDIKEALQIVLDLARENILDQKEVDQDPEILQPMVDRQKLACDTVEDMAVNQFGDD